jgi:hypothetical protein
MRWTASSVLSMAAPRPGKCFAVATTPPAWSPSAKGTAVAATSAALEPKPRSVAAIVPPGRATSSTGARSTLMPKLRRLAAVSRPWARLKAAPRSPISSAEVVGGPSTRMTRPPSWSVMTSSGSPNPGGRLTACRRRISRRPTARLGRLSAKRMRPATLPSRISRTAAAGGRVPEKPNTIRWPASWARVSWLAALGRGACPSPRVALSTKAPTASPPTMPTASHLRLIFAAVTPTNHTTGQPSGPAPSLAPRCPP